MSSIRHASTRTRSLSSLTSPRNRTISSRGAAGTRVWPRIFTSRGFLSGFRRRTGRDRSSRRFLQPGRRAEDQPSNLRMWVLWVGTKFWRPWRVPSRVDPRRTSGAAQTSPPDGRPHLGSHPATARRCSGTATPVPGGLANHVGGHSRRARATRVHARAVSPCSRTRSFPPEASPSS